MTEQRPPGISEMDREYFNSFASGYSPYTDDDIARIVEDLAAAVARYQPRWGCEVGSADGQFSAELAKRVGNDLSLFGLDIADQILQRYPFHKVCGSAFQFPCADKSLDMLCCAASYHHLDPFDASLAEMSRVLAPGGLIYFLEPNYFHPQRRFFMTQPWLYHRYRKANDVPVNPLGLVNDLDALGIETLKLRYINLHFKNPGLLQKTQNQLASLPWPDAMQRYIMPWFILIGRKKA